MVKFKFFTLVLVVITTLVFSISLSAHGYVKSPASRGYQGSLDKTTLGYTAALEKYGSVINEPWSLEAPKGFPAFGPADGRIASANGSIGGSTVLDLQTADRWKKTDISTGVNTFLWTYSAYHSTAKWHYYITKQGWNPNKPLAREDLEFIGEVLHDGSKPSENAPHSITIPSNRQGYHVIVAIWDVADTANAFYNVIDVNVRPTTDVSVPPAVPEGLTKVSTTSTSARISWTRQADANSYVVYRNGQMLREVSLPEFEDTGLSASTSYTYEIQAKGASGLTSQKSQPIVIETNREETSGRPMAPANLHSMQITSNSVSLMWTASDYVQGIKKYEIFENGLKIGETTQTTFLRTGLLPDTEYQYTVRAIAQNDQISDMSNQFSIRTRILESTPSKSYCGAEVYNPEKAYPNAQTTVYYACRIWKNKWYANPNEVPGADLVWEEVSICSEDPDCELNMPKTYCGARQYDSKMAYPNAKTKVLYACKIWENKWYANPGEMPGSNAVWTVVSSCNENPDCATSDSNVLENDISLVVSNNQVIFMPETVYGKISEVSIFNALGVKVLSVSNPTRNNININSFPAGVYIVNVLFSNGSRVSKTIRK